MTTNYADKIEAGLKLWLKEVHGIDAISAELNESEVERVLYTGCETCGYGGGSEDKITTTITYRTGKTYRDWGSVEIEGTSINFLPELLSYIDRAEELA